MHLTKGKVTSFFASIILLGVLKYFFIIIFYSSCSTNSEVLIALTTQGLAKVSGRDIIGDGFGLYNTNIN